MNARNRFGIAIATAALGVIGTLGLVGCGVGTTDTASASLSPEATALTALGFTDTDVTTADGVDPASDAPPSHAARRGNRGKHPLLRRLAIRRGLGKHIEHGEITVSTKSGDKTVEVQRGVITAISDTSISVKCNDGFTMTWTIGSRIHVLEHRTTVQPNDLVAGDVVGVAGVKDGSANVAKLIVVPNAGS